MSHITDIFKGKVAGQSLEGGGGNRIQAGLYKVQLTNVSTKVRKDPSAPPGAVSLIVEFKFVESNNAAHMVGSSGAWTPNLKPDPYGFTLRDFKRLIFCAAGWDPKDPDNHQLAELYMCALCDPACEEVEQCKELGCNPSEDILGKVVSLEGRPDRKKNGDPFVKLIWS